jgi:hypothetical protein
MWSRTNELPRTHFKKSNLCGHAVIMIR